MKLREYLDYKGITVLEFAKAHDIHFTTVFKWLKGTFKPNKFYREVVRKATRGKVKDEDW